MKKIFIYLLLIFNLQAEEIQIVFSHSLNGNLLSCPCARIPIAGLSRRASFFQKNFSISSSIFLELGNFFSNSDSFEKKQAILESFKELNYSALIPAKIELENQSIDDWKVLNRELLLASNVKEKGFFRNSNLFLEKKLITKSGKKFLITSFFSQEEFSKLPNLIQKKYEFVSIKSFFQNNEIKENFDSLLIILIGELESFHFEDFPNIQNKILFLASGSKLTSKTGFLSHPKFGRVYTTSGNFGNELGVLKLNLKTNSHQLMLFNLDVDKFEDSPIIKKIASKYEIRE